MAIPRARTIRVTPSKRSALTSTLSGSSVPGRRITDLVTSSRSSGCTRASIASSVTDESFGAIIIRINPAEHSATPVRRSASKLPAPAARSASASSCSLACPCS